MQVAAPVKEKSGALMGALAFILRPEEEFTRVLSVARSGLTGETFAFDQNGLMISQSRFDEQLKKLGLLNDSTNASSALSLELRDPGGNLTEGFRPPSGDTNHPLARMIADAVEGGAGVDVNPSRDYRGVPVVGAWRWLPQYGFGVATKIDAAEAYQPLKVLRLTFIVLVLLLALCTLGVLLFSYSNLVWRRKFNEAQLKAIRLGQYTLKEKIGEGGMGTVYKAQHALLRRETAIKLLLPEKADDYTVRQFEREVQLTCQLTHPNTIQVYDYGHTPEGIFYYAMEFLRGLTLSELVKRHGAQPEARVLHILAQVCESLKEAHAAGLIHRDIKPGNIFLCERGGVPDTVKVLDFGLVKHLRETDHWQPDQTGFPLLVGTPQYMPPETIKNPSQIDARGDIYAVGAVGYFLMVGRNVFDGDSAPEIFQRHLSEAPIAPSQRTTNSISADLEGLILRCLEKDPNHRPQTAAELLSLVRACSQAAAWTSEKRVAWWSEHVKDAPRHQSPTEARISTAVERTVEIAFEDRSG
jgi:serine/threonine protein kinase